MARLYSKAFGIIKAWFPIRGALLLRTIVFVGLIVAAFAKGTVLGIDALNGPAVETRTGGSISSYTSAVSYTGSSTGIYRILVGVRELLGW